MSPVVFTSAIYLIAVILCLLAMVRGGKYEMAIHRVENVFSTLAARPLVAALSLFLGVILIRLAVLSLLPVPMPDFHDEFSYLLLGDTLAHGRLTNPPPPLWKSFETFHVNVLPTYCSKYPPAQGFVLAIGELLGNPWLGVLLSAAAMSAVFYWALRAWLPARWAWAALAGFSGGPASAAL